MKTTFFTAAFALCVLCSCKKDYTCECTETSPSGTTTENHNTGKMKLSDARARCDEGDESHTTLGQTYTTDCTLQ